MALGTRLYSRTTKLTRRDVHWISCVPTTMEDQLQLSLLQVEREERWTTARGDGLALGRREAGSWPHITRLAAET